MIVWLDSLTNENILMPSERAQSAASEDDAPILAITGMFALEALATISQPHRPLSNKIWLLVCPNSNDFPMTLSTALCRPMSSAKQIIEPLIVIKLALCIPPVLAKPF